MRVWHIGDEMRRHITRLHQSVSLQMHITRAACNQLQVQEGLHQGSRLFTRFMTAVMFTSDRPILAIITLARLANKL